MNDAGGFNDQVQDIIDMLQNTSNAQSVNLRVGSMIQGLDATLSMTNLQVALLFHRLTRRGNIMNMLMLLERCAHGIDRMHVAAITKQMGQQASAEEERSSPKAPERAAAVMTPSPGPAPLVLTTPISNAPPPTSPPPLVREHPVRYATRTAVEKFISAHYHIMDEGTSHIDGTTVTDIVQHYERWVNENPTRVRFFAHAMTRSTVKGTLTASNVGMFKELRSRAHIYRLCDNRAQDELIAKAAPPSRRNLVDTFAGSNSSSDSSSDDEISAGDETSDDEIIMGTAPVNNVEEEEDLLLSDSLIVPSDQVEYASDASSINEELHRQLVGGTLSKPKLKRRRKNPFVAEEAVEGE